MRDGEIKHLERGCLTTRRDEAGVPYRWLLTGRAFKGEHDPHGIEATWVVGQAGARAVRVLEALLDTNETLLFKPIPLGPGIGPTRSSATSVLGGAATRKALESFVQWINCYCSQHDLSEGIPDVDGRPWRFTTRQFRRTLAWFIARQPGGSIAGAIAYRHHSVLMFEGYAGTTASGFRQEVEAERALARGDLLLEMIDQNPVISGPAAAELQHRLEDLSGSFEGMVITDPRRRERLLKSQPQVFPSTFVTCVYDPAKALCEKPHTDALGPATPHCQPLLCRNVALTPDNRTQWRDELGNVESALRDRPDLAPLLRHRLEARRQEILELISGREAP